MPAKRRSTKRTGNPYVVKRDGKWCVIQKGTGRILSRHATKALAGASFRAMEMHKRGER